MENIRAIGKDGCAGDHLPEPYHRALQICDFNTAYTNVSKGAVGTDKGGDKDVESLILFEMR